eukprot:357526-Amorphochlora_amoeboformis.AAC.1
MGDTLSSQGHYFLLDIRRPDLPNGRRGWFCPHLVNLNQKVDARNDLWNIMLGQYLAHNGPVGEV